MTADGGRHRSVVRARRADRRQAADVQHADGAERPWRGESKQLAGAGFRRAPGQQPFGVPQAGGADQASGASLGERKKKLWR